MPPTPTPTPARTPLRVHVLGSSAGGGLPQWNCGCPNCRAARAATGAALAPAGAQPGAVIPRTQSSIVVSGDGGARWVLINASPDVRTQLASFAPLAPPPGAVRGSGLAAVLVTNADIDHAAGLLVLREGGAPPVYGTARVRDALTRGLTVLPVLAAYGPVEWRELAVRGERAPLELRDRGGAGTGVLVRAFPVASKPSPYMLAHLSEAEARDDYAGDTVGLIVRGAAAGGGVLAYVPGVRDLDARLAAELAEADTILIDGTFWTDDELIAMGASAKTARVMGHAPLSGAGGIIEFLGRFPRARRKVLIHVNNSNPVLVEGSGERAALERAGIELAYDGLELGV